MKSRLIVGFVIALLAVSASTTQAAPNRQTEFPPFDWSNAQYDPTNGGYCDPGGMCAAPHDQIPSGFGQYCTSEWCSYPSNDLCIQIGMCGGIGTGGGSCDYSTDCFANLVGVVQPPPADQCPPSWPICAVLYGTPTPPPPTPGNPTPTPQSGECPLNLRVSQQPPTISANKLAPEYPIVVGQDPTKRGVDLSASVVIHPVIVKYDVAKYERECQYVGGNVTDSACQNNPGWKNKKIFVGCETKTEVYPDRIDFATIEANLSPASIAWITGELAAKYPGAHVYQAYWSLWPGRAPSQGGMSVDGTSLNVTYLNTPFRDPGQYSVLIRGSTTGTPYTAPRSFSFTYLDLLVHLLESTIIK